MIILNGDLTNRIKNAIFELNSIYSDIITNAKKDKNYSPREYKLNKIGLDIKELEKDFILIS
jgi:hypothetical protein